MCDVGVWHGVCVEVCEWYVEDVGDVCGVLCVVLCGCVWHGVCVQAILCLVYGSGLHSRWL